jgi:hypothetical protein
MYVLSFGLYFLSLDQKAIGTRLIHKRHQINFFLMSFNKYDDHKFFLLQIQKESFYLDKN